MKRTHEMVEKALVGELLKGNPMPGSHLLSERDLAARYAVSRATVREALLKLQRSGWISVQQRHPTIVNDFWSCGDFQLLSSITRNSDPFPADLALDLLELRGQFAPDYARRAVENDAAALGDCLSQSVKLRNSPGTLVKFDGKLHLTMAVLSRNKIYPLIMNSFSDLYSRLKGDFFGTEEHRVHARRFYQELMECAAKGDAVKAEEITRAAMTERLENFKKRLEHQRQAVQECSNA